MMTSNPPKYGIGGPYEMPIPKQKIVLNTHQHFKTVDGLKKEITTAPRVASADPYVPDYESVAMDFAIWMDRMEQELRLDETMGGAGKSGGATNNVKAKTEAPTGDQVNMTPVHETKRMSTNPAHKFPTPSPRE